MPAPHLAAAADIVAWADRTESRVQLPDLVRRLVLDTASPTKASFRSHEGTDLGGYDGWVEAPAATPHVPAGTSVWEMGTNKNPSTKAGSDLRTRTKSPDPADPAATEFVFCTPRRWAGKDAWLEKNAGGPWKDVRAYDADDLAAWLATSPGTHVWFSLLLGLPTDAVRDLRSWWAAWAGATAPPVSPPLLLAGRGGAAGALRAELEAGPGVTVVQAGSPGEARAFVAATLLAAGGPDDERLLNAALVVDDRSTWRFFADQSRPLLLLPDFHDAEEVGVAVQRGHHVVVAVGAAYVGAPTVRVPPLSATEAMVVLEGEGLGRVEARHAAGSARRNMAAYRRMRAVHPALPGPPWTSAPDGPALVGPTLVGRWDGARADDRALVEAVAGRPYADVEDAVRRSADDADPAFKRTGTVWKATAKELAWTDLSRFATADDLVRFADRAVGVLLEDDPLAGLDDAERLAAQMEGVARPHSQAVRSGLADSLAMLGSLGADEGVRLGDGADPRPVAAAAVRRLFEACLDGRERWALLAHYLPALAEAAPDTFLAGIEGDLRQNEPTLFRLYEPLPGLFGSDYHYPKLLWALEKLAWSPDHFARVVRVLAQIDEGAPPTKLLNSASDSLTAFFRPGLPQCGASADARLKALSSVRDRTPDAAWRLMLRMVKTGHSSVSIRSGPGRRGVLWRSWPSEAVRPTMNEVHATRLAVSEWLVEDAGDDPARWATLAGRFHDLAPEAHDGAVPALLAACAGMGEDDRTAVWEALRALLAYHGSYPEAGWSMPAELVDRLGGVADRIAPTSTGLRSRWLFSERPQLLRTEGRDEWDRLQDDRKRAVEDILSAEGVGGVAALAPRVESPSDVGAALGQADPDGAHKDDVLALLRASKDHRALALGYLHVALRRSRPAPVAATLGAGWGRGLAPEVHALVFRQLPLDANLLDEVETAVPDVQTAYWRSHPFTWTDDPALRHRIIGALLAHRLPRFALDVVATAVDGDDSPPVDLVARTLHAALTTPIEEDPTHVPSYDVVRVLAHLRAEDEDRQRLLTLEWLSLPLIYLDAPDLALHDELAANPGLFADLVGLRYKNDDGEVTADVDESQARAAYHLAGTWTRVPGLGEDGAFDEGHFDGWVRAALAEFESRRFVVAGHLALGDLLVHGPQPQDGVWPHPAVCRVIEEVAEEALDDEFRVAVRNLRGMTVRGPFDGGAQERALAETYDGYAVVHADRFPRVAALLRRLAASYRSDAKRQDLDAEHGEDDLG